MASSSLQSLVDIFIRDQPPVVWSLLVSVFGDLAQNQETRLNSDKLGQITQAIGIKPEATRVALHRLRKEGWLQSERTGRTSVYSLTEKGHAETVAATPRIYSADAPASTAWLVITDNALVIDGVNIAANTYITSERPASGDHFAKALTPQDSLPSWMTEQICSSDLVAQTASANTMLRELEIQLKTAPLLSPNEVTILRVLIVHTWRRVVLRCPQLPDMVFPRSWEGPECRSTAHRLLQSFLPPPSTA